VTASSCPYCAASLEVNARRCAQCGAALEDAAALPAGTQVGAYTLARTLGQGGFGITYATSDAGVAVKEFYAQGLVTRGSDGRIVPLPGKADEFRAALERFTREAKVLRDLDHPGTTAYIAFWQENGTAYLAMEYLSGESLEARISRHEKLSEARARRAMLEVLALLEVVHAKGLLHRDIKPGNIVLTARRAELIDFGSATTYTRGNVTTRLLTPEYAPLEFYGSNVQLAPASDLYSLCATFYEAITLHKPPSAIDRMNGARVTPVRNLEPEISKEFADVLETGLALRIDKRHSRATGIIETLKNQNKFSQPQSQRFVSRPSSPSTTTTPQVFGHSTQGKPHKPKANPPSPNVMRQSIVFLGFNALVAVIAIGLGIWNSGASLERQREQHDAILRSHAMSLCLRLSDHPFLIDRRLSAGVTNANSKTGDVDIDIFTWIPGETPADGSRPEQPAQYAADLQRLETLRALQSFVLTMFAEPRIARVSIRISPLTSPGTMVARLVIARSEYGNVKRAGTVSQLKRAMQWSFSSP
jgi:serine/threonine protein kinase